MTDSLPPIQTEDLTAHLPGQDSKGPLRYVIFSDEQGPLGALWMATAHGDEAVGWEPNLKHPEESNNTFTWRLRITTSQARPFAPGFESSTEQPYTAESFFRHWTEEVSHEPLQLDGPHDFAGPAGDLADYLDWL